MRASVIIPHYNDLPRLRRCLAALWPMVPEDVEVIVVDNGSTEDPAPALADAYPRVRFLKDSQSGAAHARNHGVAKSSGDILLFLDADCVPAKDWLATGLRLAPTADILGGHITVFDETPPPRSGAEAFEAIFAFNQRRYIEEDGFAASANIVTTRAVFDAVGPFRPALSEDKDWSQRAVAAGFSLTYAGDLKVQHPSRQDWPALRRKWRRLTDEMWALHRATGGGRMAWVGRALLMPVSILAHMPRVLGADCIEPADRGPAVRTLARLRLTRMIWMLRQALAPPQ